MSLFPNIKSMKKHASLSSNQQEYFHNLLVDRLFSINKNPSITHDIISANLILDPSLTIFDKNVRRRSLDIKIHYLFFGEPFVFDALIKFDHNGDYTHYFIMSDDNIGFNVNSILHLIPIYKGVFNIEVEINNSPTFEGVNEECCYVAKFKDIFSFEEKIDLASLSIEYKVGNLGVIEKYFKYKTSCGQRSFSPPVACNAQYEPFFIDFMNVLFANDSILINDYRKNKFIYHYDKNERDKASSLNSVLVGMYNSIYCNPFMLGRAFQAAGDLFIALMDSPLKASLLDELKVYEMATY